MKRSDLKELIKKSMLEVAPKSGAMTPEEEKMVADYEEEEVNKYALDNERPLEEALNKDIKAFGQDLDKAFKAAGFTEPRFFTSLPSSGAAVISN